MTVCKDTDDDCVIALRRSPGSPRSETVQRIRRFFAAAEAMPGAGGRQPAPARLRTASLTRRRAGLPGLPSEVHRQRRGYPIAPPPVQRVRSACSCQSARRAAQARAAEEARDENAEQTAEAEGTREAKGTDSATPLSVPPSRAAREQHFASENDRRSGEPPRARCDRSCAAGASRSSKHFLIDLDAEAGD